jgi:hypothetical protein
MSYPSDDRLPLTIECGDHQRAPYCFVCIHLIRGDTDKWVPVDIDRSDDHDQREVDFDYYCPLCYVREQRGTLKVRSIRPICVNCVRTMQKTDGYNPPDLLDDEERIEN